MQESNSVLSQTLGKSAIKKVDLLEESFGKYLLRAIFAGLYLMIGSVIAIVLSDYFKASPGVGKLLYSITFGWGLIIILNMNAELATSNMMYLTNASINKYIKVSDAVKVLLVCVLGNFIGSFIAAAAFNYTDLFNNVSADHYLFTAVSTKFSKSYSVVFVDAILANILVNIAIVGANRIKNEMANITFVIWVIFIFSVFGFEHVIANFGTFTLAKLTGLDVIPGFTWGKIIIHWLITIVGNYIGGGLVIGGLYAWLNKTKTDYTD